MLKTLVGDIQIQEQDNPNVKKPNAFYNTQSSQFYQTQRLKLISFMGRNVYKHKGGQANAHEAQPHAETPRPRRIPNTNPNCHVIPFEHARGPTVDFGRSRAARSEVGAVHPLWTPSREVVFHVRIARDRVATDSRHNHAKGATGWQRAAPKNGNPWSKAKDARRCNQCHALR